MAGPQIPDNLSPYGANGSGEQDGAQSISAEQRPMPDENLAGYGTTDGRDMDHRLSYPGMAGNTEAGGMRGSANDHTRASKAGKPARGRGQAPAPFDTVPGTGASDIDKAGRAGGLPDPVFRKGSGTTQRP